jgi:hypothetical protein
MKIVSAAYFPLLLTCGYNKATSEWKPSLYIYMFQDMLKIFKLLSV